MNKISVLQITKDTYKETFGNPVRFIKLSSLWLGLLIILSYFAHDLSLEMMMAEFYVAIGQPPENLTELKLLSCLHMFASVVIIALMTGSFARASMTGINNIKIDTRTIFFVLKYIVLFIIAIGSFMALFTISTIIMANTFIAIGSKDYSMAGNILLTLMFVFAIISMYLYLRLSMVLPYTFTDAMTGIKQCWKMTKGSVCRLWCIVFLTSIPVLLLFLASLIQIYDADTDTGFSMAMFIAEHKYAYISYAFILAFFTPLYGTMIAKIYKAFEANQA